jgi:hypothetical protein
MASAVFLCPPTGWNCVSCTFYDRVIAFDTPCYAPHAGLASHAGVGKTRREIVCIAQRNYIDRKKKIMFNSVRKFARALRVPSAQDREMAYLNESRDRIDLEYRMRQVDRGMFRKSQF